MLLLKMNGKFGTQTAQPNQESIDSSITEPAANKNSTGNYLKLMELLLKMVLLFSLTLLMELNILARSLVLKTPAVSGNLLSLTPCL